MVTYAQLKALDPHQFEQAATGWHTSSRCAENARDKLRDVVVPRMRAGLKGEGASAAVKRLEKLAESFHYAQVQCGLVRAALNGLAGELRTAKKKLENAVQEAQEHGMKVNPDGSVRYTEQTQVPYAPGKQAAYAGTPGSLLAPPDDGERVKAQGFADRMGDAVREATRVDTEYAGTLRHLITTATLAVSQEDWADAREDRAAVSKAAGDTLPPVPKDRSPEANRDWWKGLSPQERDAYVALRPASVGALDGIPAEARDEANRVVFNERRAKYQMELDNYPPEPKIKYINAGKAGMIPNTDDKAKWQEWHDRREHLKSALNGMKRIQTRFDDTGGAGYDNYSPHAKQPGQTGLPHAYLLGFSPEDNGRAIIANGNPDTADHTAVMVPGMNTTLGGINKTQISADNLWQASTAQPGNPKVSTVNWFGYDSPQGFVDAAKDGPAESGGKDLNRFMHGLETAQGGPEASHNTVIGHSYGSNVVGVASRDGFLRADDIVFAGSPGVSNDKAADLDAPTGHVWNERAGDDNLVPEAGRFVHGGGDEGNVPSDPEFGAHRMKTHDGGHGGYWWEDSDGLSNQAKVVTGRYGGVDLE